MGQTDTPFASGARRVPAFAPVAAVPRDDAVSWPAILAGAAGTAALSLILLILGSGLGLSSISPWAQAGITATTFGVTTIGWITLTQIAASGLGGYLSGRLRTRWSQATADESYFRDTAHGLLSWAVATLLTAALLGSAITSILGAGMQAGTAGASKETSVDDKARSYFVDMVLRPDVNAATSATPSTAADPALPSAELLRIFGQAGRNAALSTEDLNYAAQIVSRHTGLAPEEAQKRVGESYGRMQAQWREAETTAREAADKARKAAAYAALWLFVSLLAGAFFASLCATVGGRQRDA